MFSKFIQIVLGIIFTFCFVACNQTTSKKNYGTNPASSSRSNGTKVTIEDGNIILSDKYNQSLNLQIKVGDEISYSTVVEVNQKTSISSLLKANKDSYYDIALLLAQNNGDAKLNLRIAEVLDTTIVYHLDITETSQYTTKAIQGKYV